jgi:F-type H+-transporting ATPase subunit b
MNVFLQSQIILAHEGFGINPNILETNVINQVILVLAIAFLVWPNLIGSALTKRQEQIIQDLEDSEKRLNESTIRLQESKKQLSQACVIIEEIQKETLATKVRLLNEDYLNAKTELTESFTSATKNIKNRERLILQDIKKNIALLALKQVLNILENKTGAETMLPSNWRQTYMTQSIKMVGVATQSLNTN